jgi:hypothetical protein
MIRKNMDARKKTLLRLRAKLPRIWNYYAYALTARGKKISIAHNMAAEIKHYYHQQTTHVFDIAGEDTARLEQTYQLLHETRGIDVGAWAREYEEYIALLIGDQKGLLRIDTNSHFDSSAARSLLTPPSDFGATVFQHAHILHDCADVIDRGFGCENAYLRFIKSVQYFQLNTKN